MTKAKKYVLCLFIVGGLITKIKSQSYFRNGLQLCNPNFGRPTVVIIGGN